MFVVCGEALFDVFATGDTPTGDAAGPAPWEPPAPGWEVGP